MYRPSTKLIVLGLAQFGSNVGDRFNYLALVSLLTLRSTMQGADPATDLFLLGLVMLLPALLFAPWAGPIVDRLPLIGILVVSDLVRGITVLFLPFLFFAGGGEALFAGVFLVFLLNVFFLPARAALPPHLVERSQLFSANAFLALITVFATLLATGAGGWVIDRIGWRSALYLDGATFLLSALVLFSLRGTVSPVRTRRRRRSWRLYGQEVVSGFTLLARSPRARFSTIAWLGLWIAAGVLHVAGPLHIQARPGEVQEIGWVLGGLGIGLAASMLWAMRTPRVHTLLALSGGLGGAAAGLALFAASDRLPLLVLGALLAGLSLGPLLAASETELQEAAGERRRGRAFAIRDFLSRILFLISSALAVLAVRTIGAGGALLSGSAAILLIAIFLFWVTQRKEPPEEPTALKN